MLLVLSVRIRMPKGGGFDHAHQIVERWCPVTYAPNTGVEIRLVSERLNNVLDEYSREGGLVAVVAPSGYGKSALASDWCTALSERTGSHVERFSLSGGCRSAELVVHLERVLEEASRSDSRGGLHCVVEDLHQVERPHLGAVFRLLGDLCDKSVRVMVTSAAWSSRLFGLFARTKVRVVDVAVLRFTYEEVRQYFELASGGPVDDRYVNGVLSFTEGWRTGVHLLSLERDADTNPCFFSKNRLIDGYFRSLLEDVCSEGMRDFLFRTSYLDELTPELCAAIMEGDFVGQDAVERARDFVSEAEQLGLYVTRKTSSVDSSAYYERPFKLWAQSAFAMERPSAASASCLRASKWFEAEGKEGESVKYLLMARAMQPGFEGVWDLALPAGEVRHRTERVQWLSSLDPAQIMENPALCVLAGWFYIRGGMYGEAEAYAQRGEESISALVFSKGGESERLKLHLRCLKAKCLSMMGEDELYVSLAIDLIDDPAMETEVELRCIMVHALAESFEHLGEVKKSQEHYREALALSKLCGDAYALGLSVFAIARRQAAEGNLYEAEQLCRDHLSLCPDAYRGLLHSLIARLCVMGFRLEEAGEELALAEPLLSFGNHDFKLELCVAKAMILQAKGEIEAACSSVMHGIAVAKGSPLARRNVLVRLQALWAYLLNEKGDAFRSRKALSELDARLGFSDVETDLMIEAVRMRLRLSEGDIEGLGEDISQCIESARSRGHVVALVEFRILESRMHLVDGSMDRAFLCMTEALDLGAGSDLVQPFAREVGRIAPVLQESVSKRRLRRGSRRFCEKLLEGGFQTGGTDRSAARRGTKRETLTAREREVLDLLAKGMSRGEIAGEMRISRNTVKVHIAHIYEKLGVGNRLDALHAAREEMNL